MNWKEWIQKGKNNPAISKKSHLLLILLSGLLLVVIAIPADSPKSEQSETESMVQNTSDLETDAVTYGEYLEKRIAKALEYVDGVGKTEIVITLSSNGQKIVEKDQQSSSQTTTEEDSNGGVRNVEDKSSERTSIYTQDADGAQIPYISEERMPEIKGVIVIAEGGDDAVVVQNITEAIQALFGVEAHKIKIMKRTDT